MKYATLVYQAGIANVFAHVSDHSFFGISPQPTERKRLIQSDFHTCEAFARGLSAAGVTVRSAWCNEAGDIINSFWRFCHLEDAPFSDKFRPV